MTEKKLFTRIINKHGNLETIDGVKGWNNSTLKLKEGEIALAKVMVDQPDGTSAPTFVMKVGIEGKTFTESPWLFAKASDVYSWAKAPNKPNYKVNEIEGIADYISKLVQDELGLSVNTNTLYQIVVTDTGYKLQSKDGELDWTDVTGSIIDLSSYITKKDAETLSATAENNAKAYADSLAVNYDAKGSADQALTDAKKYTDEIKATLLGENDKLVATYDTLSEIVQWIESTGVDATELTTAIAQETSAREAADKTINEELIKVKETAEAAQTEAEVATAIENKITELDLPNTYQTKGNYASSAQGEKADSALQEITTTAGEGLIVTNKNHIDIDSENVTFVFDCGGIE